MKKILLFLLLFFHTTLYSQSISEVKSYIIDQFTSFPQEKIYIHTDKAAYVSGEKIWYRVYLVNAALHIANIAPSRYVYVDLIDPMGKIISKAMLRPDEEDCYHNCIQLDGNLPEGYYMIRAYTRFMLNRPDYLFEKKVFVSDTQSFVADVGVRFSKAGTRQGNVKLAFKDKVGQPIEVERYMAGVDTTENLSIYTADKEFPYTPEILFDSRLGCEVRRLFLPRRRLYCG